MTRRRIPLGWVLTLGSTGLAALGIGLVLAAGLIGTGQVTETLLRERVQVTISTVYERWEAHLDPAMAVIQEAAGAIELGRLNLNDAAALQSYLTGALAAVPQVAGFALIRIDGPPFLVSRRGMMQDTGAEADLVARALDWGRTASRGRWIGPAYSSNLRQPIIVAQMPLHGPQGYLGLMTAAITVRELSRFTAMLSAELGQTAFILYDRQFVLAHPTGPPGEVRSTAQQPLPSLADQDDPILARIWDPAAEPLRRFERAAGVQGHRVGDVSYVYREIDFGGTRPLIVGVYYPERIGAAELAQLRRVGGVGITVLVLTVVLTLWVGRRITGPVARLEQAAGDVVRRRFDGFQPLPGSRVREFDRAARAFNRMVEGLQERERMRDLFGKYVPEEVAVRLLGEPGAAGLAGEKRAVTVMFTDINGFTGLAEQLAPDRVVWLLNGYFELVCQAITQHNGIIVDFVGDAVFALFGAPIARADHAAAAIAAARAIDHATTAFAAARRAEGLPFGLTRIAIHTGIVTVGSIGARDRLKYGATGDVVNVAARMEPANKELGTRLIASAAAVAAAGETRVRPIGALQLRGHLTPIEVFELLHPDEALVPAETMPLHQS